jgi:hypothetical protein
MTTQLHDTGEEFAIKDLFREDEITKPADVSIGLFNDATDALSDTSDVGDINTEPSGAAYATQTASFSSADFTSQDNASGNWEVVIADQVFDTSDSSQDVDAYYVEVTFQAEDTGDGSANAHLYWTGDLDQTYDLNSVDQFTLSGAGLEIN